MRIRAIEIRRFRSIENAGMRSCGGLNVLIGKNNSGKSNILATIDLVHRHLYGAAIAGPWSTTRVMDEFTDRQSDTPLQIGIEFELPQELNQSLRERLQEEAPHLERSIEQVATHDSLAVVIAGVRVGGTAFLFLEQLAVGALRSEGSGLGTEGINLLSVPVGVAKELFDFLQESTSLRSDLGPIERLLEESARLERMFASKERDEVRYYLQAIVGGEPRPKLIRQLSQLISSASTADDAKNRLSALAVETRERAEALEHRQTEGSIDAFAGATKTPPAYAIWLMKTCGSLPMMHLRETRDPIGREEAEALLTLKVTRGGPERLQAIQKTVRSLLGVDVDAFQSEDARRGPGGGAEMDIDQFLVEANGAGVREAIRLVLDLELKKPKLLLLEEPEVHLHPGLEHAVYSYLRERSQAVQMFVTTHSTNFVDSVSFQNIYLVSRDETRRTALQCLDAGDGALRIPAELGLRLSTVFMYDRLLFVEGPSDEAVIRALAKTLDVDLAAANVGFVQMGGVRNFAHFAAQATIDLLARRRIQLWFVADRDERDDVEVGEMVRRLGEAATLKVLDRRELENYLLDPSAIARFIAEKCAAAGLPVQNPAQGEVRDAILQEARQLKDEVIRLRHHAKVLKPVFLQGRKIEGDAEVRLTRAIEQLTERRNDLVLLCQIRSG